MIKIAGAILFMIAGLLLGRSVDLKYGEKEELWKEIAEFITFCESEITYSGTNIDEICEKTRQGGKKFSVMIADCIQYNTPARQEMKTISDFITELKSTDLTTQKKLFDSYTAAVLNNLEKAQNERIRKGKTYARLLPLLGIGMILLLW